MLSPSTPLHNNLSPSASQFISVPSSTVSVICNSNNNNDSDIVNNNNNIHISTCLPPHDLVLAGVQEAASISPPPVYESLIFSSVMHEIFTLPVSTISHVPRKVRPLLAQVITTDLQHARLDGLWGFTHLSLFPKAVLRPPPRGGRKKWCAVDALIVCRIRRWHDGDLEALWLEARNDSSSRRAPSNVGDAVRGNVKRALRLAREGRYSDAMQALGSIGYAPSDNVDALNDIMSRHPTHPLPVTPVGHTIPPFLTVDQHAVSCALKSFPRGT